MQDFTNFNIVDREVPEKKVLHFKDLKVGTLFTFLSMEFYIPDGESALHMKISGSDALNIDMKNIYCPMGNLSHFEVRVYNASLSKA